MGLDENQFRLTRPIYGFTNQSIRAKSIITLPITLEHGEHAITIMADFLVVDQPSTYNDIIGRPLMKKTSMVTTVCCLTVKFFTPTRISYIKANQATT